MTLFKQMSYIRSKAFKYVIGIFIIVFIAGVIYATYAPKSSLTLFDEMELRDMVSNLNKSLPIKGGTIGSWDSITYQDHTMSYIGSVNGDQSIRQLYIDHYDDFKESFKFTFLEINGQKNLGNKYVSFLDSRKLNIQFKLYTSDLLYISWTYTGAELKQFLDSCRISPTESLRNTLMAQINIANIHLPMKTRVFHNINSVAINSLIQNGDDSILLHSISFENNNLIVQYVVDETKVNLDTMQEDSQKDELIEAFCLELTKFPDTSVFLELIALTHSGLRMVFTGRSSHQTAMVDIPYEILKKYCKVPSYLLS